MPVHLTKRRSLAVIAALAVLFACFAAFLGRPLHAAQTFAPPVVPMPSTLAAQGELIFGHTSKYAPKWTGNTLSCTDCHLIDGTIEHAAPLIDVANLFPSFSKRAGHVITLQERIQECFVRSENGKPLPVDSPQMKALVAYIQYLSRDGVKGRPYAGRGLVHLPRLTGHPSRGRAIYVMQCATCHQPDGSGIPEAYPPVWGPMAYNTGAGMHRVSVLAAWTRHNMPLNRPGSLTPQQSYDVAAYIDGKPHPAFNPAYKSY